MCFRDGKITVNIKEKDTGKYYGYMLIAYLIHTHAQACMPTNIFMHI